MKDLLRAKELLKEGHTCVLCCGDKTKISDCIGIRPMVDFLEEGEDLSAYSAADKIVGKAAAHLFCLAGVKAVYGEVMSHAAKALLEERGIFARGGTMTDSIVNRQGTGPCPMESAVASCSDSEEAFRKIKDTLSALRRKNMKKLGFGLMRLPKTDPEKPESIDIPAFEAMIDRFLEKGYTYFDTAYMYHNHESERAVKKALSSRIDRNRYMLATKMPTMRLKEEGDTARIFAEQQEKCGVERFDYYLIHCLDKELYQTATKLDVFGFCLKKKAEGKIGRLGFSFHDTADVLDKILTEHPEMEFVQLQINYLDWESPTVQSRLCYEVARKHGKEIIIMEPIRGGALAKVPESVKKILAESNHPERSPSEWALRFCAGLDGVILVLSGMSDLAQLEENTDFMSNPEPLTAEEVAMLFRCADEINRSLAVNCTGCAYCTEDCPKQIPIPQWFELYNQQGDPAELAKNHATPADCIACGKCEKHCPQKLPIRRLLAAAQNAMKQ